MKSKLSSVAIPFPYKLMSSNKTATNMTQEFARDIRNMYIEQNGAGVKRNGFSSVFPAIGLTGNIVQMMSYIPPSGVLRYLAFKDDGALYVLNDAQNGWDAIYSGLSTSAKLRYTHFASKLIIYNGVNDVLAYDGKDIAPISQWVKDKGADLTYVDAGSFTIRSESSFYDVGEPIKIELGALYVESVVQSVSQANDITTITLTTDVLDDTLVGVYPLKKPPKFSYMCAMHDKLWGFGNGAITSGGYENPEGRGTVYYTDGFSDETKWYNESGATQYINMADKLPRSDVLVAMGEKDGFTVFFFRNHTQIWSGYNPSAIGDFAWSKTIPVGAVHADLIVSLQNDLLFFTQSGVRSLSRVMQTEQLDIADIGGEMDVDLTRAVSELLSSDEIYKKAHSFSHPEQGWFGFYIAGKTYVFQVSNRGIGWVVFDGLFNDASTSLTTEKGELFIANNQQVFKYDTSVYSDNGTAIQIRWWTPWLKRGEGTAQWANKYVEIVSDQSENSEITAKRFKDYNNTSYVVSTLALPKPEDYWDDAYWDTAWFDHALKKPALTRDKFVATVYSYAFEQESDAGPLTIYGFKLHGVNEKW